jgi:hypothetical protein
MSKSLFYVSSLAFLLVMVVGLVKLHHRAELGKKIQEVSQIEADGRKLCTSESSQSRLDCMRPRLEKVSNPKFQNAFSLFVDGKKIELKTEDLDYALKIKRTPEMILGGKCMSNFFYFDFDSESIFLSKDNIYGVVVCVSGNRRMILYPSQISEQDLNSQLEAIKKISF